MINLLYTSIPDFLSTGDVAGFLQAFASCKSVDTADDPAHVGFVATVEIVGAVDVMLGNGNVAFGAVVADGLGAVATGNTASAAVVAAGSDTGVGAVGSVGVVAAASDTVVFCGTVGVDAGLLLPCCSTGGTR